jgi:hypothetical protein
MKRKACGFLRSVMPKMVFLAVLGAVPLARTQSDSNEFEKISQEQGAQEKGNAYGRGNEKDTWYKDDPSSGLSGYSTAAPLPPVAVMALLGSVFALKAWKTSQKKNS